MSQPLYHVTTRAELDAARESGFLAPPSLAREGFVHCCLREQIAGVLARYFRGAGELVLLEFDGSAVGVVRVEAPPGRSVGFPHVYGPLPLAALRRHFILREAAGGHELPRELVPRLTCE